MIAYAGSLHHVIVQSLLGEWENNNFNFKFNLVGGINNLQFVIIVNNGAAMPCRIAFSNIGECTIVPQNGNAFNYPILALFPIAAYCPDGILLQQFNRDCLFKLPLGYIAYRIPQLSLLT